MNWLHRYLNDIEHRRYLEAYDLAAGALLRTETTPKELIDLLSDKEMQKKGVSWTMGMEHAASAYLRLTKE